MIPNPILYNENTIIIGIIACSLILFAGILIPKALRHKKQVKQSENEKSTPNQKQEVEISIIPKENMKSTKNPLFDYRKTFLTTPKIVNRKPVFISEQTRMMMDKIARQLGDRNMSASGFLENMAKHHLEEYQKEITQLNKE